MAERERQTLLEGVVGMRAGQLRHRLALQSNTQTADDYGQLTDSWATYDTVWGSVKPLRGDELLQAQQMYANISHLVRVRYNGSILPTHRISHDSRILEINAILNTDERDRELMLYCTEAVD